MGEDPGILSCAKSQVWTPDDFNRFIQQGNEKTNLTLLSPFPVWVYQPTPNDSISLKVSCSRFFLKDQFCIFFSKLVKDINPFYCKFCGICMGMIFFRNLVTSGDAIMTGKKFSHMQIPQRLQ